MSRAGEDVLTSTRTTKQMQGFCLFSGDPTRKATRGRLWGIHLNCPNKPVCVETRWLLRHTDSGRRLRSPRVSPTVSQRITAASQETSIVRQSLFSVRTDSIDLRHACWPLGHRRPPEPLLMSMPRQKQPFQEPMSPHTTIIRPIPNNTKATERWVSVTQHSFKQIFLHHLTITGSSYWNIPQRDTAHSTQTVLASVQRGSVACNRSHGTEWARDQERQQQEPPLHYADRAILQQAEHLSWRTQRTLTTSPCITLDRCTWVSIQHLEDFHWTVNKSLKGHMTDRDSLSVCGLIFVEFDNFMSKGVCVCGGGGWIQQDSRGIQDVSPYQCT